MQIFDYLSANPYPGRGIMLGYNSFGAVIAYFIMGRSENSRNRVFEQSEDGIRTRAFDESKCSDPSLIIYSPVRKFKGQTIVTNGDQTDTVYDELCGGGSFESALQKRKFEPDAPNFTPRISGILDKNSYQLSILKCEDGLGNACVRNFFRYEKERGIVHLIHTYEGDSNPLPCFEGEPRRFALPDMDLDELAQRLFDSLNHENRIALFARFIDDETGRETTKIINKNT